MATVFLGALQSELGFRQLVAIKRPHPHLQDDRGFREAWLREARLASGIHHANVVDVRDIEVVGDAIQLVMDYIEGASLGELVAARAREGGKLPAAVAVRVVLDACAGLHAAHEAEGDDGHPLAMVHRDVSPQNILVGLDGVARVTDFGIAKCADSLEPATSQGMLKGKAGYMAPEYVRGEAVDRRADVFALGVVLWEALVGKRLFRGDNDSDSLARVLAGVAPPVSAGDAVLRSLDGIVAAALARDRSARFSTAEELARRLEQAAGAVGLVATHADVGRFVRTAVGERLAERRQALRDASRSAAPPAALELLSETTPVPERRSSVRRRSLAPLGAAAAIGLACAGAGVFALGRSHPQAAVPGPSVVAASSLPPATAPAAPSLAPVASEAAPPPSPVAVASTASSARKPARGPQRPPGPGVPAPAHGPPPNPYPTTP